MYVYSFKGIVFRLRKDTFFGVSVVFSFLGGSFRHDSLDSTTVGASAPRWRNISSPNDETIQLNPRRFVCYYRVLWIRWLIASYRDFVRFQRQGAKSSIGTKSCSVSSNLVALEMIIMGDWNQFFHFSTIWSIATLKGKARVIFPIFSVEFRSPFKKGRSGIRH